MAAKRVVADKPVYAIRITHADGTVGWLTGADCDVKTYQTEEDASKALRQMKRGNSYSWNCMAEAAVFTGFSRKKGE